MAGATSIPARAHNSLAFHRAEAERAVALAWKSVELLTDKVLPALG